MEKQGKKTIYSTVLGLALAAVIFFVATKTGCMVTSSGAKFGYAGSSTPSSWTGTYASIKGTFSRSFTVKEGVLNVEITTKEGSLTVEITDENKAVIYSNTFTDDEKVQVPATGKVKIKLTTDGHSGSYSFK